MAGVTDVVEEMSRRNREMFKVPPYVLYVSRAFSTLEGIGLSVNKDYSIVKEAFPYLSRRLFTDDSPRARAALRSMVYGKSGGTGAQPRGSSFAKLVDMSDGFTSYTSSTGSVGAGAGEAAAEAVDSLVATLLSEEGSFVQQIFLEETAKLADAMLRDSVESATRWGPAEALGDALKAPKRFLETSGPLGAFIAATPLSAPAEMLDDISNLLPSLATPDEEDRQTLEAFSSLWDRLAPRLREDAQGSEMSASDVLRLAGSSPEDIWAQVNDPQSQLRQRLPLIGSLGRKFGATLLRRVSERLEENSRSEAARPLARAFAEAVLEPAQSLAEAMEEQGDEKEGSGLAGAQTPAVDAVVSR